VSLPFVWLQWLRHFPCGSAIFCATPFCLVVDIFGVHAWARWYKRQTRYPSFIKGLGDCRTVPRCDLGPRQRLVGRLKAKSRQVGGKKAPQIGQKSKGKFAF
jgi:hypothetical protein